MYTLCLNSIVRRSQPRCRLFSLFAVALLLLTACSDLSSGPAPATTDEKLNVVATTGQIGDTLRNLGGDRIELTELLGPGIDPHTYVPTESDLAAFEQADIIFYNGLHLEAQMDRVLEQIGQGSTTRVVAVGEALDPSRLLNWQPEAGLPHDPHIWNDVTLWMEATRAMRDGLIEADPANAEFYTANAEQYMARLDELHSYMLATADTIPANNRVLVTAHDAFSYFGRAYGFEVEAVQGISTQTEASAADIQALVDIVIEKQVPAIFVETTISPRTIEAVQEAAAAAGQPVEIGGQIFSDAMGEPGSPAGTYIGMMTTNINTIAAALGGEPGEGPGEPDDTATDNEY